MPTALIDQNVNKATPLAITRNRKIFYGVLALIAVSLMVAGIIGTLPYLMQGAGDLSKYFNFTWAHDQALISQLVISTIMFWLVASVLFWGGWLLRRSVRKLRGETWRVMDKKNGKLKFFPPTATYLRISCYFLSIVLLFVVAQYPIQYMIIP